MKGIISEMNLDIDPGQMNDLMGQIGAGDKKKEEEKEEEDKAKKD
jgi:Fe-S cluster assembly ATPase SufC